MNFAFFYFFFELKYLESKNIFLKDDNQSIIFLISKLIFNTTLEFL